MLALVAILLFALFGFGALTVDLGLASLTAARLQHASDAVALACPGASEQTPCGEEVWRPVYEATLPAPGTWTPMGEATGPVLTGPQDTVATWTLAQTVPLLFGHGSLIAFDADDSTGPAEIHAARNQGDWFVDDPVGGLRESGFRIGARSYVRFAPVVRIGRNPAGQPARAPFALAVACSADLSDGVERTLSIQTASGAVSGLGVGTDSACPAYPLPLSGASGYELGPMETTDGIPRQAFEEALIPSGVEQRTLYAPVANADCPGEECAALGFMKLDAVRRSGGGFVLEVTDNRAAGNASALCRTVSEGACPPEALPHFLRAPVLIGENEASLLIGDAEAS